MKDHAIGVDLSGGTGRDRMAVSRCERRGDSVHVRRLLTWQGSPTQRVDFQEVEDAIAAEAKAHQAAVVLDPYQGLQMAQRLRSRGLQVTEFAFTSTSRAKLYDTLLQLIRQRKLKSYQHPELRAELNGLRWVERGGILRPDHTAGGHDDLVIAVALAAQYLVENATAKRGVFGGWVDVSESAQPAALKVVDNRVTNSVLKGR